MIDFVTDKNYLSINNDRETDENIFINNIIWLINNGFRSE
jgi:hypothetical protein